MVENEIVIWNFFKHQGFTDAGTAGIMGNLFAESGLNPHNLQNTFNKSLGFSDDGYTSAVDNGLYDNFIHDKAGYGLAQWTFWSRKERLFQYIKQNGKSIGDLNFQLNFLMIELNSGYKKLVEVLKTTSSVLEASNAVLLQFERPADQSLRVQQKRYSYGKKFYNKYKRNQNNGGVKMKYSKNNPPLICMQTNSTCYQQTRKMKILGVLWHSTGANNPTLKRYIQPAESDPNYNYLIKIIGKNNNGNDYNHISLQSGLNAWIGKTADGSVKAVQTMPWDFRPWGCGSGPKGSCNTGWIQFEICEDNLNDPDYFNEAYQEACELTAYLCDLYNIDPNGSVVVNGVRIPTILCHADSHNLGFGSNHGDILHWSLKYNKNMATVRQDVNKLLKNNGVVILPEKIEEDDEMTQEQFNEMMNNWIAEQANRDPSAWSANSRQWAEKNELVKGDAQGRKMYKKFITREEFMEVLCRALNRPLL